MSDEKASDDGLLDKAKRLADRVGEYARSDEVRNKLDSVRERAIEVGGKATAGAKRLAEGTKQAAALARDKADELSKSERAQAIKAKAREDWDEIKGGTFRGSRLSQNPVVVAIAILLFFPIGLYLLWKHPVLCRNKKWWWAGGAWGLFVTLAALGGKDRAGPATPPLESSRSADDVAPPAARQVEKQAVFNVWAEPLAVLEVDRPESGNWVQDIDFAPDGRYLITNGRLWTTDGWRLLNPERRSRIHGGLFSPDSRSFASAWGDQLLVWTITDDRPEVAESYKIVNVSSGLTSEAGTAISFPYEQADALWTMGGVIARKPGISTESGPIPSTGGLSPRDSRFPFLEAGARRPWFKFNRSSEGTGNAVFAFSARGRMMARIFDGIATLAANGIPGYEELPHRERIVEVWSWPGGGKPLFRTRVEGDSGMAYDNQIAFLSDGKTFVMTSSQKDPERSWTSIRHVVFLDTTTWKETNRFQSKEINFHIAAVSPDGSRIATASGSSRDFAVTLWNPTSPEPLRVIKSLYADQVLFTPDGRTLVTAVEGGGSLKKDKTYHINLYDVASGACAGRIKDRGICSIAVSPDGQYLVSGHSDSVAKVWDLRKGTTVPYEDEYGEYNLELAGEAARDTRLNRPAPPITREAFGSLQVGMKYDQVRELLGGSEHTSKSVARMTDPKYHSYEMVYVLGFRGNGGPGSGAALVFGSDGITSLRGCKLIGMEETGLR